LELARQNEGICFLFEKVSKHEKIVYMKNVRYVNCFV